jgi:hypothetical protein
MLSGIAIATAVPEPRSASMKIFNAVMHFTLLPAILLEKNEVS